MLLPDYTGNSAWYQGIIHVSKVTCMHMHVQNWGSRCKIHLFLIPEIFTVCMSIHTLHACYFLLLLKLKNKIGLNLV